MITEQMRLWAYEFCLQMRYYSARADLTRDVQVAMAAGEAEQIYPLEPSERKGIADLYDQGRIDELVKDRMVKR